MLKDPHTGLFVGMVFLYVDDACYGGKGPDYQHSLDQTVKRFDVGNSPGQRAAACHITSQCTLSCYQLLLPVSGLFAISLLIASLASHPPQDRGAGAGSMWAVAAGANPGTPSNE